MQSTGIFQQILLALEQAIRPGAGAIREELLFYLQIFLFFELLYCLYALVWHGGLLERTVAMFMRGALVYWALFNFPSLLQMVQETFIQLGLLAGGNSLTVAQFLDPGQYLATGIRVMALLYDRMHASFSLTSLGQAVGYFGLWVAFMASFAVMAVNVMIWQVELLIAGVTVLMLLPTLAFRGLAWIGQGSLSLVVNLTFRFGLGALLASLTFPVLDRLTITTPVSFQSVIVSVIGGWFFAFMFWQVNKMASHMLAGMATLAAGTVAGAVLGAAVTAGAVLSTGAAVAGAAVGSTAAAGGGGLKAGQGLIGAGRASGGAMRMLGSGGGERGRLGAAVRTLGQGSREQMRSTALSQRLGSFAGGGGRLALGGGQRSWRQVADVARYLGQDHAGYGARHH